MSESETRKPNENKMCRDAAWKALFTGRWVIPLVWYWVIATSVNMLVIAALKIFYKTRGIQTWTDFTVARAQHLLNGLDFAVPNAEVERQMWLASGFEWFVTLILTGMVTYGLYVLVLRTTTNDRTALVRASCAGLARPLDCAWLLFRQTLQIALWSLLFLIPGIVAFYAYSQAWFVKVEHPEYGAGKCIAESKRLMKGAKWGLFSLDCSYWATILVMTVAPFVGAAAGALGPGFLASLVGLFASLVTAIAFLYLLTGRAIFYIAVRDAPRDAETDGESHAAELPN